MKKSRFAMVAALMMVLLGAAYLFWQQRTEEQAPAVVAAVPLNAIPLPILPTEPAAPTVPPAEPAVRYPVDAIKVPESAHGTDLPALMASDAYVKEALIGLLGRKNVLGFLQLDGFVRRVVATVDNLGREHAPPMLWPVDPTPGRFSAVPQADAAAGEWISPDNSQRYGPLVGLIESIDTAQAVRLYVRLYPLFQQAYEELGFPKRYFNDRLVAVIDQLLATPVPTGPVGVRLVEVKGPIASQRPWVRYEFSDPERQAMMAGQKILLRTGPDHHRRLHTKLLELRRLVAQNPGLE